MCYSSLQLITVSLFSFFVTELFIADISWSAGERNLSLEFLINGKKYLYGFYIPDDFPEIRPMCFEESDFPIEVITNLP
jgi:hypothetical protein